MPLDYRSQDPREQLACRVATFLDALDRGTLGPPGGIDHRDTVESIAIQNLRSSLAAVRETNLSDADRKLARAA